mgnify:CR=1 FL=1
MTTTPAAKAKTTASKTVEKNREAIFKAGTDMTVEKNAGEAIFKAGTDYDHPAVTEQAKAK